MAPRVNLAVYIAYLDEAGTSDDETHLVVAGIIVREDQLLECEKQLDAVLEKHIPEKDREGFEFHAHQLFGGRGYFKNKRKWTHVKRQWIIKDVLDSLLLFKLPIIYGAIDKAKHHRKYAIPFDAHDLAFMLFAERVDDWLASNAPFEVCILIADETKRDTIIKSSLRQYRKEGIPIGHPKKPRKLHNIADAIYFANSKDTWGLQVADFCNFFIKRHLIGGDELAEKMYKHFSEQIDRWRILPD
jgi:Protein of unknown function (DUF3800)